MQEPYIGVLFLDVSKSFDTVDHGLILSKLSTYSASLSSSGSGPIGTPAVY